MIMTEKGLTKRFPIDQGKSENVYDGFDALLGSVAHLDKCMRAHRLKPFLPDNFPIDNGITTGEESAEDSKKLFPVELVVEPHIIARGKMNATDYHQNVRALNFEYL